VVTAAPAAKAGIDTATIPTDENAEIDAALLSAIEPGVEGGKIDDALRAQLAALGIDLTGQTPALPADLDGATPVAPVTDGAAAKTAAQPAPAVLSAPVDAATEPTGEIAAQLNALNVGAGKPDTAKTDGKDGKATSLIDALMRGMNADDAYKPVLNTAPVTQNTPAQTPATGGQTALPAAANDAALMDDPLFKIDLSALSPDRLLGLSNAAVQVTGNAAKHAAGTPAHSALSAVALHLQSLAQNRDTRSLTLQLNPPELGKLQVKMTYGRDKTVKADIAVEKSDTLALLQKDADGLRQALSDAGLNADAGSLNFSLANDNTFADQMQDGEGDGRGSGNTDSDIELGAIEIKSSEEWSVDSRTGIVRYNIVV
jgi:flagellar hook-length control protein FliK